MKSIFDLIADVKPTVRSKTIWRAMDPLNRRRGGKANQQRELSRDEVLRGVERIGNKVNLLAFRYLWPANKADPDDALNGLLACCWKAKGNLFVADEGGHSIVGATEEFISDELMRLLKPYRRMSRKGIAELALAGRFKYLARTVRNRMRDRIREIYRAKRERERLDYEPTPTTPSAQEMDTVFEDLCARQELLSRAIGVTNYWTLRVGATSWQLPGTRKERKARVTRAIASALGLSGRQARERKRDLLRAVEDSTDPMMIAIRTARWFKHIFASAALNSDSNSP